MLALPTLYSSCILLCSPPRHDEAQGTEGGNGFLKFVSEIHIRNDERAMAADSFVTTWGGNTKFKWKTLRSLPPLQHGC
jgi:hypothetical protein